MTWWLCMNPPHALWSSDVTQLGAPPVPVPSSMIRAFLFFKKAKAKVTVEKNLVLANQESRHQENTSNCCLL